MNNRKGSMRYFFKAVALSVKIKSPASIIVSVLGFGAAFFPMLISLRLQTFTNDVQALFNQPVIPEVFSPHSEWRQGSREV